jgi:hypothetical protein
VEAPGYALIKVILQLSFELPKSNVRSNYDKSNAQTSITVRVYLKQVCRYTFVIEKMVYAPLYICIRSNDLVVSG